MSNNLLKPSNVLYSNIRTYIRHYKWEGEGIKYPGFTYYPRSADFKDPEYTATKLFRVQRIKPIHGNPYWENEILKSFGLDGKKSAVAVVKNIPENNARLYKIKHLIQIEPITFPNGPLTENDIDSCYLKENGELIINKKLKASEDVLEATEKFDTDPRKLNGNTLRRDSMLKWLRGWTNSL